MREFFFNLVWLLPLFPLAAFAIIVLWTNRNRLLSTWIAWLGIGLAWILGWTIFALTFPNIRGLTPPAGGYQVPLYAIPTGSTVLRLGFQVDTLTSIMLLMVPFVCLMIFIYSRGYMNYGTDEVDARYSRFFAYISLFACGMLGLVVSNNFVTLLIFWEIMGLCSYLLIGFWFDKSYPDPKRITPKEAGLKAFLTTRIGDVIMLAGILLLYSQTGTTTFREIFSEETLHQLAHTYAFPGMPWATLCALLIFGGAVGKSSQFPLHVWLPDAMEGPTPVSALIHAATMVSAGVYLVARSFPLFIAVPGGIQLTVVSFIGAFTALFASTIALAQNDIKRVLAYSTISQLGYMIAALGIGAYVAAVFHLITHAFFKALLFMGSGSVIHGVEHGHHHAQHEGHGHEGGHAEDGDFDANDMMNMGGLLRRMPATGWTFIVGALALTGIFPWAGFWSKDEILAEAWYDFTHGGAYGLSASWAFFIWLLLTIAALLTAFYTGRQIFLTFGGKPRTEAAKHAPESTPSMTWPLIILAGFATFLGLFGMPWANQVFRFIGEHAEMAGQHLHHGDFDLTIALISTAVALSGWLVAWLIYGRKPLMEPVDPLRKPLGPVYTLLENKYYVDELYHAIIIRPSIWLADRCAIFDRRVIDAIVNAVGRFGRWLANWLKRAIDNPIIDGAVNGVGKATTAFGEFMRATQTGNVQNYLLVAAVTVLLLLALFLVRS
ncbi:NADH-quinone oxidoreductase subunit L [Chloroflexota bacterium]